jgi:hypothetical protein
MKEEIAKVIAEALVVIAKTAFYVLAMKALIKYIWG